MNADVKIIIEAQNQAQAALSSLLNQVNAINKSLGDSATATSKVQQAQNALSDEVRRLTDNLGGQAGALGRIASSVGGIGVAAAATAGAIAATGLAAITASKQLGDYYEQTVNLQQQLGLTARELGALTVGASNTGRTIDSVVPAFTILTRTIGEAAGGSEQAAAKFRRLGISYADVGGNARDTGQVIRDVAARLNDMENAADRNRAAFELFGRAGAAVLPILREDFEELARVAEEKGIILSSSAEKTAKEADAAWDQMSVSIKGLQNTVAAALAPIGTALVTAFDKAATAAKKFFDIYANRNDDFDETTDALAEQNKILREREQILRNLGQVTTPDPTDIRARLGVISDPTKFGELQGPAEPEAMKARRLWEAARAEQKITAERERQWEIEQSILEMRQRILRLGAQDAEATRAAWIQGLRIKSRFDPPLKGHPQEKEDPGMVDPSKEDKLSAVQKAADFLESSMGTFTDVILRQTENVEAALVKLAITLAAQAIPGFGPFAGILNALPFQRGGAVGAQHGLVVAGVRGVDTVPVRLGRGEGVIDHNTMDDIRGLVSRSKALATETPRGPTNVVTFAPGSLQVTVSGGLSSAADVRRLVNRELMPEIARSLRRGSFART